MRAVGALVALLFAMAPPVAGAAGAAPPDPGPGLAFTRWSAATFRFETVLAGPTGAAPRVLAGGPRGTRPSPAPYSGPSWFPDGERLVFAGLTKDDRRAVFVVNGGGGTPRLIPGTEGALYPVLAPSGHEIAFTRERGRGRSIWTLDLETGKARRLTPWRQRTVVYATSYSPDGSSIGVTVSPGPKSFRAVSVRTDGSGESLLAAQAMAPAYSPDGSRLAVLRITAIEPGREGVPSYEQEVYVGAADGSGLEAVTHTPGFEEGIPSWDPSGSRLVFTRAKEGASELTGYGIGASVIEANADGTCAKRIFRIPSVAIVAPVWRPGPGRGVPLLTC